MPSACLAPAIARATLSASTVPSSASRSSSLAVAHTAAGRIPYPDNLALVSEVGARRDEFGGHLPYNDPDQLRAGIEDNLVSLGVGPLTAVNLRLLDGAPVDEPFVDQLGELVRFFMSGEKAARTAPCRSRSSCYR
jgi:hypothetical protein